MAPSWKLLHSFPFLWPMCRFYSLPWLCFRSLSSFRFTSSRCLQLMSGPSNSTPPKWNFSSGHIPLSVSGFYCSEGWHPHSSSTSHLEILNSCLMGHWLSRSCWFISHTCLSFPLPGTAITTGPVEVWSSRPEIVLYGCLPTALTSYLKPEASLDPCITFGWWYWREGGLQPIPVEFIGRLPRALMSTLSTPASRPPWQSGYHRDDLAGKTERMPTNWTLTGKALPALGLEARIIERNILNFVPWVLFEAAHLRLSYSQWYDIRLPRNITSKYCLLLKDFLVWGEWSL